MWFSNKKSIRIQMHGRAGFTYREGDRAMSIDSEMLAGPSHDIIIYSDSIKQWQSPHQNDPLSADDKTRIKANIERELKKLRIVWA